ncbi:MAG: isochorismatase family protein [candidate division Zixibacteria bacterium]|nr:isochorismatase family protein [candidate division Zixibacteria bacterium]
MKNKKILIVVDVQVDFCEGGALAVSGSGGLIPELNKFISFCEKSNIQIIFTKDWHPVNHHSFKSQIGKWPPHCIQNSVGAELHPDLYVPKNAFILTKGESVHADGYSAFENKALIDTMGLDKAVKVYVCGLALDYCVKATAIDAIRHDFSRTYIILDLCRAISIDNKSTLSLLKQEKVAIATSSDLMSD